MQPFHLAIVGSGPRGLAALEALCAALARHHLPAGIHITIFESCPCPGAGPVYDPGQPATNWLNLPERELDLPARPAMRWTDLAWPAFPTYREWAAFTPDPAQPDVYPPRSKVGTYLNERYRSLVDLLLRADRLTIVQEEVIELRWETPVFVVETKGGGRHRVGELLLAIGHQPTSLSDQLRRWKSHAEVQDGPRLFTAPYPVQAILETGKIGPSSTVGFRGLGLSMIDVVRGLLEGLGGRFEVEDQATLRTRYEAGADTPHRLAPFSLDGLPPAPKPISERRDSLFMPHDGALKTFGRRLEEPLRRAEAINSPAFLRDAMAEMAADVYLRLGDRAVGPIPDRDELIHHIKAWLRDETHAHPLILDRDLPTEAMLRAFTRMATGEARASLDYALGQVWRHVQRVFFRKLAFSGLDDEVVADIIGLHERMKRYAFGPPVASARQLLALLDAGVMTLDVVCDPEIKLVEEGWTLRSGDRSVTAQVMINTVLPGPRLLDVTSPLVRNLLEDDLLRPVHAELGVCTEVHGRIKLASGDAAPPLALMGRLAKGSIIGADSLIECFGPQPAAWADDVLRRVR